MMRAFSAAQKRREAEREISYRRQVYAKMVHDGRMTQEESDMRIAIMQDIARDYRVIGEQEEPTLKFPDSF